MLRSSISSPAASSTTASCACRSGPNRWSRPTAVWYPSSGQSPVGLGFEPVNTSCRSPGYCVPRGLAFSWYLFPGAGRGPVDGAAAQCRRDHAGGRRHVPGGPHPGPGHRLQSGPLPEWWSPCGQAQAGRQYVRYDGRAGGAPMYVSEIGHPAGLDLLMAGWPIMRIAAQRGDRSTYGIWEGRLDQILDEYIARPPNPAWSACKTVPYVSDNLGYHWAHAGCLRHRLSGGQRARGGRVGAVSQDGAVGAGIGLPAVPSRKCVKT